MDSTNTRTGYIAGLRQLADLLEQHDELPLPYHGHHAELLWIASYDDDHKQVAADFARLIPGTISKSARGNDFDLYGQIAGLAVQLIIDRDQVCERVVVGTEKVTVPAVEAQPERVEEREVVEWRCHPILSDGEPAAAEAVSA